MMTDMTLDMTSTKKFSPVLQLNSAGEPLGFIPWIRAAFLIWAGEATIVAQDVKRKIKAPSWETPAPLIIQLPDYVMLNRDVIGKYMVKEVVYNRDNWQCQYCGKKLSKHNATIDHIKPVSAFIREGKSKSESSIWSNVILCCQKCNSLKADKLPAECGMYPMKPPKKPTYVQVCWAGRRYHPIQAEYVAKYFKIDPDTLSTTEIPKDFDWEQAWAWA